MKTSYKIDTDREANEDDKGKPAETPVVSQIDFWNENSKSFYRDLQKKEKPDLNALSLMEKESEFRPEIIDPQKSESDTLALTAPNDQDESIQALRQSLTDSLPS